MVAGTASQSTSTKMELRFVICLATAIAGSSDSPSNRRDRERHAVRRTFSAFPSAGRSTNSTWKF